MLTCGWPTKGWPVFFWVRRFSDDFWLENGDTIWQHCRRCTPAAGAASCGGVWCYHSKHMTHSLAHKHFVCSKHCFTLEAEKNMQRTIFTPEKFSLLHWKQNRAPCYRWASKAHQSASWLEELLTNLHQHSCPCPWLVGFECDTLLCFLYRRDFFYWCSRCWTSRLYHWPNVEADPDADTRLCEHHGLNVDSWTCCECRVFTEVQRGNEPESPNQLQRVIFVGSFQVLWRPKGCCDSIFSKLSMNLKEFLLSLFGSQMMFLNEVFFGSCQFLSLWKNHFGQIFGCFDAFPSWATWWQCLPS